MEQITETIPDPYNKSKSFVRVPILLVDVPNVTVPKRFNKKQVCSELEVLDEIIYMGYDTLETLKKTKKGVSVRTVLKAIELKNKLTDMGHKNLTGYGIEELKRLEEKKFQAVLDIITKYIPGNKQDEVIAKIENLEEGFYANTIFYEDYIKARAGDDQL